MLSNGHTDQVLYSGLQLRSKIPYRTGFTQSHSVLDLDRSVKLHEHVVDCHTCQKRF